MTANVEGASRIASDEGNLWQPGAGGMAVHTILLDPKNEKRIFIAISAAARRGLFG